MKLTPNLSATVLAALTLDKHSTDYQVRLCPEEALGFAEKAEPCGIGQAAFASLIQKINSVIPNSQNGQPIYWLKIGNEGSRVMYVEIIKNYLPKYDGWLEVLVAINQLAKDFSCDEFDIKENTSSCLTLRLWWD